jgi:hypothetical protein
MLWLIASAGALFFLAEETFFFVVFYDDVVGYFFFFFAPPRAFEETFMLRLGGLLFSSTTGVSAGEKVELFESLKSSEHPKTSDRKSDWSSRIELQS